MQDRPPADDSDVRAKGSYGDALARSCGNDPAEQAARGLVGHHVQIHEPNPVKIGKIRHNCVFLVSNVHL